MTAPDTVKTVDQTKVEALTEITGAIQYLAQMLGRVTAVDADSPGIAYQARTAGEVAAAKVDDALRAVAQLIDLTRPAVD